MKSVIKDIDFIGSKTALLGLHGIVDTDKAINAIKFRTNIDCVDIDYVNNTAKEGMLFLNEKGIPQNDVSEHDEKLAKYKLVPLGYTDKFTGKETVGSFIKGSFAWEGIFVGTLDQLIQRVMTDYESKYGTIGEEHKHTVEKLSNVNRLRGFGLQEALQHNEEHLGGIRENYNNQLSFGIGDEVKEKLQAIKQEITDKPIEKQSEENNERIYKGENTDESIKSENYSYITDRRQSVYDEIYKRLLVKENWKASSKNRINFYIKCLIEKVWYEQSRTESLRGNGYILSEDRTKCLFNTGLIDIYNNDIYLLDYDNNEREFYKKIITLPGGKGALIGLGFNKEDIKNMPKPVKFYESKGDMVFNGSIEDFDLQDNYRLNHIIQERRDRFPEKYRELSSDVLAEKINYAITKAVRLSERDYKYIVPMYNLKQHKIDYFAPLHLDASLDESPELVILLGNYNGFYSIYTILTTDDAYDNARLLCRPDSNWLKISNQNLK